MIGTVIDGNYRVEKLVGQGAFGVVYECTELDLKRRVALKMLKPNATGERELRRFLGEGRNLASLNHPNVVQIHRLGNHDGRPYIVMEFVDGRTLRELLHGERMPTRQLLEIMYHVASGLAVIHGMGILHRDLSPNNILVMENGTPKILDLGLSKVKDTLSSADSHGYMVGTFPYVAPEQINGHETDFNAEIFSFGVILYEVLAGVHPFRAEHHMSLLYNIAQRPPAPLSSHLSDCPPALSKLVERCLEKAPEDRPGGMAEVVRSLDQILSLPGSWTTTIRAVGIQAGPRETPRNPYLNRVMIKRREEFFGRTQEIKRIYARLNATPPGSISIVGDRKIGKSSLLNYIYARPNRQQNLEAPDKTVMVFLDLQEEKGMSMQSFVGKLLGIANMELRGRLDVSDCALSLDGIKDLVQRLDGAGFRLAILLDEFEAVTTNPNFSLEFFSFLRFLANHYDVAYITSSARDLQVLCHTQEIKDSPFFNIFSTMRLSVFQREEALSLISVPSERAGKPLQAHAQQILDIAGLFPFFLQMACSHSTEYLDEHPDGHELDFGEIRRRFYEEAKLHYRYIWEIFDTHEKSTILRVARGQGMPDALKHVLAEMENRHYVEADRGRPRVFASTFEDFVKGEAARGPKRSILRRLFGGGSG
jgi:serine/threonine-protein kinase